MNTILPVSELTKARPQPLVQHSAAKNINSTYINIEERAVKLAQHIPLASFILDNAGNFINWLITLWQTVNSQSIPQAEKQGIIAQESGKLIASFTCLPVFLLTGRITQSFLKNWSPASSKAASDIIGIVVSFLYNDIVGSLLKNWLSVNFLNTGISKNLLSLFGSKDKLVLSSLQEKKLTQ